jgi:hypothetical protein
VKRKRRDKLVDLDRAKTRELIAFAKRELPEPSRWLVRNAIEHARSIANATNLEFDQKLIERTIEAADSLARELAQLPAAERQTYRAYLSQELQSEARSLEEIALDLNALRYGLKGMLKGIKGHLRRKDEPRVGAKQVVIEEFVLACAHWWKQAGKTPGRQVSYKRRGKPEVGSFKDFLYLAFKAARGDTTKITDTKIRDGLKRFKGIYGE